MASGGGGDAGERLKFGGRLSHCGNRSWPHTSRMELSPHRFANARPLFDNGFEPAASRVTVILSAAEPFRVNGRLMSGFVAGPQTAPLRITYPANATCFEWSFSIIHSEHVLGLQPIELCNQTVALTDLPRTENVKRALDGSSMSFDPNEVTKCPLVQFAWDELRREGRTTLGDLSDRVGLSLRRLEQVFRNTFDLSPKQVQSLFRYERATAFLRDGNTNLVETALLAGYSDQSHMTREFRRFAAVTPATMRAALRIAE